MSMLDRTEYLYLRNISEPRDNSLRLVVEGHQEAMSIIKTILREEDIEGLIQIGAPADEYDSEAHEMASAIARFGASATEQQLVLAVEEVWKDSFGPFSGSEIEVRRDAFRRVAQRIMVEMFATRKS